MTVASMAKLPDAHLPRGNNLHYIASVADLPQGAKPSVMALLFPSADGASSAEPAQSHDGGRGGHEAQAVVGFDVEWRAAIGSREVRPGWADATAHEHTSSATVVQLASSHATVVVNLYALGVSMGARGGVTEACAAALAVVAPVFADARVLKVGLNCGDDLARLQQLSRGFAADPVVDCAVRYYESDSCIGVGLQQRFTRQS